MNFDGTIINYVDQIVIQFDVTCNSSEIEDL